eukprot:476275-Rhodomonas_salina.1
MNRCVVASEEGAIKGIQGRARYRLYGRARGKGLNWHLRGDEERAVEEADHRVHSWYQIARSSVPDCA